jgi:hypothetical protein
VVRYVLPGLTDLRRVRGGALLAAAAGDDRPRLLAGRSLLLISPDRAAGSSGERALSARIVAALRPYGHARTPRLARPAVPAKLRRYVPRPRSC